MMVSEYRTAWAFRFDPRGPLTYFNDGGVRVILGGLKFWPKVIFWGSMKDAGILLGREKNQDFFALRSKKGIRDFLGYAKSCDFFEYKI